MQWAMVHIHRTLQKTPKWGFKTLFIFWNQAGGFSQRNGSRLYSYMSNGIMKAENLFFSSCRGTCQEPLQRSRREKSLQPPASLIMSSTCGIGKRKGSVCLLICLVDAETKCSILLWRNSYQQSKRRCHNSGISHTSFLETCPKPSASLWLYLGVQMVLET